MLLFPSMLWVASFESSLPRVNQKANTSTELAINAVDIGHLLYANRL
jgi:hypothetical protein